MSPRRWHHKTRPRAVEESIKHHSQTKTPDELSISKEVANILSQVVQQNPTNAELRLTLGHS
jgi:hypothetical protein